MESLVKGLHHVTAIAGNPVKNHRFYSHILGLRFVKKTVNFDSPFTYHFYFGDEVGNPGTIMTFFPWGAGVQQGKRGSGMTTEVSFAVPVGSLEFWVKRLDQYNVIYNKPSTKLGDRYLVLLDPDGLKIELVETDKLKSSEWTTSEIDENVAIKGLYGVTLTLKSIEATEAVLVEALGFTKKSTEVNRHRFISEDENHYSVVDLVHIPSEGEGLVASGTIHHIAFNVASVEDGLKVGKILNSLNIAVTEVRDRNYFKSIYFREPGGVMFEIATAEPGFMIDEDFDDLGKGLKLPAEFESKRELIESRLIEIK